MTLSPWFQIGKVGPPRRSGEYEFEIWLSNDALIHIYASYLVGDNKIVTGEGRFIGLTFEDHWRGILK